MEDEKIRFRYYKGVRYVAPGKPAPDTFTRCGTCQRAWDDSKSTDLTPTPSGRCPFEYFLGHSAAKPTVRPTYDQLLKVVTRIAHMRCDGDEFFNKSRADDGADISNDHLQDQMVDAVTKCRSVLGISQSGPTRRPTNVHRST